VRFTADEHNIYDNTEIVIFSYAVGDIYTD